MFGARFAVFVRRARVLPGPCPATRNLSFLRFHRHRHPVVSTRCFTGLVRVGVKIPQDGNRANRYGTWRWCMSMFGARFAVFVRRARVLPGPCPATRNLSFLRFHRHRHPVVSTRCFTGLVRVGVKIPQDGNRANRYGTWRWCMSMFGARFAVFVRRARVLPGPCPATRNLSFLRFHRHRHPVVSTRCFTGLVRVGVKIPQDGNRANRYGTWRWCMSMFGARFAVFVRRARVLPGPCPATRNLSFLRFHRHRHPVVSTRCFTGLVRVGVKIPQDGNRANRYGTWRWCMSMFGARFAVFVRRARVLPGPCPATRNLSFLRFHRHRHPVVSTRCFTGLVRVGVKIPQDGNRANRYGHVAVVHEHVWRTVCSVCATGARVARPVPCNS